MKIHNWKEVIEYFLETKNDEYLWNYVTALRSGDDVHDMWKLMVTSLIRGEGLNDMAWGVSWTKDCLRNYDDEYIKRKLTNPSMKLPSHYVSHIQRGLESLAVYYRDVIKNYIIYSLLKLLSEEMVMNRKEIPKNVRHIINILYEDSKNGK